MGGQQRANALDDLASITFECVGDVVVIVEPPAGLNEPGTGGVVSTV